MAFIYVQDGQRYEDDFHFRYVNGFRPDPELKIPTQETEIGTVRDEGRDKVVLETILTRGPSGGLDRLGRRPGWCK